MRRSREQHRRVMVVLLVGLAAGWMPGSTPRPVRLPLGDGHLNVLIHEAATPGPIYLSLHDDENTAVEAVLETLPRRGGRFFEVRHEGERIVQFKLHGHPYRFDPNRIFTEAGRRSTLARYGALSDKAAEAAEALAAALMDHLGPCWTPALVAVHNNTDGAYSIHSYTPGNDLAGDAARVHVQPGQDPDDFFLVTEPGLFEEIREAGFNVVLQNNTAVQDDGSLSVYAARHGHAYVNVEAQHGHRSQQVRMLNLLDRVLFANGE